jgi:hypothetical protein
VRPQMIRPRFTAMYRAEFGDAFGGEKFVRLQHQNAAIRSSFLVGDKGNAVDYMPIAATCQQGSSGVECLLRAKDHSEILVRRDYAAYITSNGSKLRHLTVCGP